MKILLYTLLLISGAFSFGQSKKQVNAALNAELVMKQRVSDSLNRVYDSLQSIWKYTYKRKWEEQISEIRTYEKDLLYVMGRIEKTQETLSKLNEIYPPTPSLNLVDIQEATRKYQRFAAYVPTFEFIPEMNTWSGSLKRQNEHLAVLIPLIDKVSERNRKNLDSLHEHMQQIDKLFLELKVILENYKVQSESLMKSGIFLVNRLSELKNNYYVNGPDGFPKVYGEVFSHLRKREYSSSDFSQESLTPPPAPPVIIEVVEESAEFPGGREALVKYLNDNMELPQTVTDGKVSGKVYLKFVVSETGNVCNVTVKKGIEGCAECDAEAIRLAENMPDWTPAKMDGTSINSWYTLPVTFSKK